VTGNHELLVMYSICNMNTVPVSTTTEFCRVDAAAVSKAASHLDKLVTCLDRGILRRLAASEQHMKGLEREQQSLNLVSHAAALSTDTEDHFPSSSHF
jgi:hypothetical protein